MILYHGSNIEIAKIELEKCRPFKDFGRGFYTTTLKEQAWAMAKRTVRIFREGDPCITEFFLDDVVLINPKLNIKRFIKPDLEWVRFVVNNRNKELTFRDLSEQVSFHTERAITCLQYKRVQRD